MCSPEGIPDNVREETLVAYSIRVRNTAVSYVEMTMFAASNVSIPVVLCPEDASKEFSSGQRM
jgi:hypothetical protein